MNETTEFCCVKLSGVVTKDVVNVEKNEKYSIYRTEIEFDRLSGKKDKAIVHIKESSIAGIKKGDTIIVDGTLRTYKTEDGKSQTVVLAYNIGTDYDGDNTNTTELVGRLYNTRMTSSNGVTVCEARVEVVTNYSKMSRITIVAWGITAEKLDSLEKNTLIRVTGRVQSRHMVGSVGEAEVVEVAIKTLNVMQEDRSVCV